MKNTKENRMAERQHIININKATATEYPAEDCTIATYDSANHYGMLIFDGSAGKPSVHYYYRSAEFRQEPEPTPEATPTPTKTAKVIDLAEYRRNRSA